MPLFHMRPYAMCRGAGIHASFVLVICLLSGSANAAPPVDYDRDIRPIISDHCYPCHGPDSASRKADLRLDLRTQVIDNVVLAGDPDASELYTRIAATDPDVRMPPGAAKLDLKSGEIQVIKQWIQQGASWQSHWAFVPPARVVPPKVLNGTWPQNEIDYFVLARMEQAGLTPTRRADDVTLVRRLYLDLTGLPPTLEQLDALGLGAAERSATSDAVTSVFDRQTYAQLVDQLLASPHYGERMAVTWLDVARYSDTYGYQVDRDRYVWPWRDWVIRAFNRNMPYNEFITEQLAGDLLPHATDDQVLATAFNRLHPQKVEGGSVPEEFRIEYVADRTQTTATAFMGLTMQCCRCHDHKFDPITQREFYQLSALLDNIDEAGLYSYFTESVPTPTLLLADEAKQQQLAAMAEQVSSGETVLAQKRDQRASTPADWRSRLAASQREEFDQTGKSNAAPTLPGALLYMDFEDFKDGANKSVPGRFGNAVQLTGDDGVETKVGNFHRYDPFSVALWIKTPDTKQRAVIWHRSRAWTDAGSRGYQLLLEDGCLSASLIHFWPGNAIRVRTRQPIAIGRWLHVAVTYDGSSRADGLRIYVDGRRADCAIVRDHLVKNITGGGGDHITLGQRFRDRGFSNGCVDELFVFDRALTPLEVEQLHDGHSLSDALDPDADIAAAVAEELRLYYLATVDASYRQQLDTLRTRRQQLSTTIDPVPEIMVMRELPQPRPTFLLRRGAYDAKAEQVEPDTPSVLPPFPADAPRNRLGLARWLTSPNHPLTSRVAANRLWQQCFGDGLVRTPDDFGSQGEPPTHPQLFDWLARDFATHHWDVKRLLKKIVLSATYQQAASGDAALHRRDPENRLLARGPHYRLPAEMIRDAALAASGLLVDQLGGPPVKPYEVAVSFKPAKHDSGDGLYRRSLYTYWRRTAPAPVMMTFDAAKRDVCQMRRERTSSPLQALVLLNGPQFVEASRMLARRVWKEHRQPRDAYRVMFRTLTNRWPTSDELAVMMDLNAQQLAYFKADPDRAEQLLQVGAAAADTKLEHCQWAAASVVANVIMNLDQAVMKY